MIKIAWGTGCFSLRSRKKDSTSLFLFYESKEEDQSSTQGVGNEILPVGVARGGESLLPDLHKESEAKSEDKSDDPAPKSISNQ